MSDRGTPAGEDNHVLADAAEDVFDEFLAAIRDRSNWGLAKQMLSSAGAIMPLAPQRSRRSRPTYAVVLARRRE
jgi:hypothetical protein